MQIICSKMVKALNHVLNYFYCTSLTSFSKLVTCNRDAVMQVFQLQSDQLLVPSKTRFVSQIIGKISGLFPGYHETREVEYWQKIRFILCMCLKYLNRLGQKSTYRVINLYPAKQKSHMQAHLTCTRSTNTDLSLNRGPKSH